MVDYAAQAHFNNYDPSSFGWPHAVPALVPFQFEGTNFGQCARDVHGVFMAVLTELVPHIPGGINFGPHDDWSYSTTDDLSDGSWSFHRYGIAFDLNWRENPMGDYSANPYAGQLGAIPHDAASAIAHKYGCEYGGDWHGFVDLMHFECHLSPAVARTITAPIIATEELTMDAEVKAAFDALNARLDKLPAAVWHAEAAPVSYPKASAAQILAGIAKTGKADLAVDKHDDAQDATP